MSITYTYEIINVDPQARCMEIVYRSEGRQTMHIGARLPYQGETLEAIVQMYAPIAYWQEQEAQVIVPEVGTAGEIAPLSSGPMTLESAKAAKLAEIANWRFQRETSGIVFNGVRIKTDRESQATITGALTALSQGLVSSVEWKADNGQWIQLGLTEMTAIARAVATHVQQCFSLEKSYVDQVNAATTIEEVQAIVPEPIFQV